MKLYLATLAISVFAVVFELLVYPGWQFSDAFDRLAAQYFEPVISDDIWLPILSLMVLAHIVAAFGLMKAKSWSRPLFVWPIVALAVADVIVLSPPIPFTPLMSFMTFVASALFGSIMLMSYSREYGGKWFAKECGDDA